MKKKIIVILVIILIVAAFTVFFALQATPGYVLNAVRADRLEIVGGVMTVPEKYKVIDSEALAGKADFNKVIIEGETKIMDSAFYGCPNLREVVIEADCDIGSRAFAACPSLKTVTVRSAGGSCADDAFEDHSGITICCKENSEVLTAAKRGDISYKIIE